jgi:hypothetical protein
MQEEEDAALARRLMEQEQQAEQQEAARRHRVRRGYVGFSSLVVEACLQHACNRMLDVHLYAACGSIFVPGWFCLGISSIGL